MQPEITHLEEKKLVGKKCRMSAAENRTGELWRSFMPDRDLITNRIGTALYSAEVFDPSFFNNFDPERKFEKWAAVEVADFNAVPEGMETLVFPAGLYAVFLHKGPAANAPKTYGYIYNEWIPASEYSLDDRPHCAVMGKKYKAESPDSEEEIWIPLKKEDT